MRLERFLLAITLIASVSGCVSDAGGLKKEDASTKRQDAARTRTDLGQKYMQQGKLEVALDNLQKALDYDSNYVDAHTVIAVLYEAINDPVKAGEHYKRAAELKPKGGDVLNNYGWFLCRQGHPDDAENYFVRALADPFYQTPGVALTNSGTCLLRAGKRDQAEAQLRRALELQPNDGEALFQLASALYQKGEYFKARAFMQRFETAAQPRPDALMLGRNIELKLGNGSAAGDYTRRLMQSFPQSEQARSLNVQGQS
jgi:type IV pilus assembly protein PilF